MQGCIESQILFSVVAEKHPLPDSNASLGQTGAARLLGVLGQVMKLLHFCCSVAEGFPEPQVASLSFLTQEGFFFHKFLKFPERFCHL